MCIPKAWGSRRHFTYEERFYIEIALKNHTSVATIAEHLHFTRKNIYREIKKGLVVQKGQSALLDEMLVYKADYAQRISALRQSKKGSSLKIGKRIDLAETIEYLIKSKGYSPFAALDTLKANNTQNLFCTKTLYNYIHAGVLDLDMSDLPMKGLQIRKKKNAYKHAHKRLHGKSIEVRPERVSDRTEFGHWEGDLIVGAQGSKTVVFTLVERKTKMLITQKLPCKEMAGVVGIINSLEYKYGRRFSDVFKTITFDNGSEFQDFRGMETSQFKCRQDHKRTEIYYAHPYSSYERGQNEVTNRFLRRKLPKGKNLGAFSKQYIQDVTKWINSYPRKSVAHLGCHTAAQAFAQELDQIKHNTS